MGTNNTFGADWHLDHIAIHDKARQHKYKWACRSWLSQSNGMVKAWSATSSFQQGLVLVEAPIQQIQMQRVANDVTQQPSSSKVSTTFPIGTSFVIRFHTGDKLRSGNAGMVRIQFRDINEFVWEPTLTQHQGNFQRNGKDEFSVVCMTTIADLATVSVWHEGGVGISWHLGKLEVQATGTVWHATGLGAWVPKAKNAEEGLMLRLMHIEEV